MGKIRHQMVMVVAPRGKAPGMICHMGRGARTHYFQFTDERVLALARAVAAISAHSGDLLVQPWIASADVGWSAQRMRRQPGERSNE